MEILASKSAGKQIERSKSGYKPSKIAQKMFADLFVYCAPDIFLENMLYVSGTENTAKVIIDVIALLLNIFASCLVAAAPEIAAFPEHGSNRIDNILCCFKSQRFYQIGTKRYKLFC